MASMPFIIVANGVDGLHDLSLAPVEWAEQQLTVATTQ